MSLGFVHQLATGDEYASCLADLEGFVGSKDMSQYIVPYVLSNKEQFSFTILVHSGVHHSIICHTQYNLNAIFFAEGGGYMSGYHPLLDTRPTVGGYSYDIFLDGAFGIVLKNKDGLPLAVMGFSVNNTQFFVSQLQGVMLESETKARHVHRSINRILWRDCFVSLIQDIAQSFGKKEIVFQSAANSYWDTIKDNPAGVAIYDTFFVQKGFLQREDGNFSVQL